VVLAARIALASVLAFAAIPKLGDAATFARDIDNYHMLPVAWAAPLAVMMPPLEILVALALLVGIHARGAALISAGMMLVFAIAMAPSHRAGHRSRLRLLRQRAGHARVRLVHPPQRGLGVALAPHPLGARGSSTGAALARGVGSPGDLRLKTSG
jgi:hypothetical protein